jgi:hypothetical protein
MLITRKKLRIIPLLIFFLFILLFSTNADNTKIDSMFITAKEATFFPIITDAYGVSFRDINSDGFPDLYIVGFRNLNRLLIRNSESKLFKDKTR